MKKILACVLALSFCTATVEAGPWDKFKSAVTKVKSGATKLKNKVKGKNEIKKWLDNLKTLISNVILDVDEVSDSATRIKNNTTDGAGIATADKLKSNADGFKAVLEDCKKNPFKIISCTKIMEMYVAEIRKLGGNVSKFSTVDTTNYGKLMKVTKEYENKYNGNLASMKTAVAEIKTGWESDVPTKNAAEKLESELNKYKELTKIISDAESTEINNLISTLSSKIGSEHKYIKTLTQGLTYLKNHAKYKQKSDEMALSIQDKLKNTLTKAGSTATKVGGSVSKYANEASSVLDAAKNITK